jgi:hypothetical protein
VLPPGTDLRTSLSDLTASQVIGLYDPATARLYFIGDATPSPLERFTLSHELTHALDDQHFDLSRDAALACQDDRLDAFVALSEGDAVQTSVVWAQRNLSLADLADLGQEAGEAPAPASSTPPFLLSMLEFPYLSGQAFIVALMNRGGEAAVNQAFLRPPASTEQILHPERYPSDAPQRVTVPHLARRLGSGWKDLEVEDVGEEWLRLALRLRLDQSVADRAAAGWDGGQYRAFAGGSSVAVVMDTIWDTPTDAAEFGDAMRSWVGGRPSRVEGSGVRVRVLFASDESTLEALQAAA